MLEPVARVQFEKRYRVVRFVCLAMVFSVIVYVGVGYFVIRSLTSRSGSAMPEQLQFVFYVLAAGLIGAVLLVRRSFLPSPDSFSAPGPDFHVLLSRYQIGHMLLFALSEAVGVLGLVLTVLSGLMVHLFRFATVALVLLVVSYPRRVH